MRVLVLGARGFVGQALVRQLVRTCATEVVAVGRQGLAANAAAGATYQNFDCTDATAVLAAAAGVSPIVNRVMGPGDADDAQRVRSGRARWHPVRHPIQQ